MTARDIIADAFYNNGVELEECDRKTNELIKKLEEAGYEICRWLP